MIVFSIAFMKIIDIGLSEEFELSKKKPSKLFQFCSSEFKLNIISVKLLVDSHINWLRLLSKFQLSIRVISKDLEYFGMIQLFYDSANIQPLFQSNKYIDRQVFESGAHLDSFSNVLVKIELVEKESINESLALLIEFKH